MDNVQQAREQGKIEGKVDMILQQITEINKVLHDRIDGTKTDVEALQRDMNQLKGGAKALWGIIFVIVTLGSGLAVKVFFG